LHSISELKKFLEQKFEIHKFNGMYLVTEHGKWGMYLDEYYLNGIQISREEIKQLIK
jgi:hypothetical protein